MEYFIIVGIIIYLMVDSYKKFLDKCKPDKIIAYNPTNGSPVYESKVNVLGYNTKTGVPLYEYKEKIVGYNPTTGEPIFEGDEISKPETKKPLTEADKNRISNTILMVVGAALVVFASIIFLASAWNKIPNLFKTGILVFVQLIFILFAYICDKTLNIPKMSKVFRYLVLAFIPINLISLSCFELVGSYLSITGEGWKLFFGISLLISDICYKIYGKLKNDKFVKGASLLVEMLGILFISNLFLDRAYELFFVLSIHNIIIFILLQGNYLDETIYEKPSNILTYIYVGLMVIYTIFDNEPLYCLPTVLLTIFYYVRYMKFSTDDEKHPLLGLFFINYILALKVTRNLDIASYFIYIIAALPILHLANKDKHKKIIMRIIFGIETFIIFISLFNSDRTIWYLLTFITGFALYTIMFMMSKEWMYKALSYIMFALIFVDICNITELYQFQKYIPLIMVLIIYGIEFIFESLKDKSSPVLIIIAMIISTLTLVETYFVIIPVLLMYIYTKLEKLPDELNAITLVLGLSFFELPSELLAKIIMLVFVLGLTIASVLKNKFNLYTVFSLIYLFLAGIIFEFDGLIIFGSLAVWSILHYVFTKNTKKHFYKLMAVVSVLGTYLEALHHLDVEYTSMYILGFYLFIMCISRVLYNWEKHKLEPVECVLFGILTFIAICISNAATDGVILIISLLILGIMSFAKKWKPYMYSSIISMVICILILTYEYWTQIPWYIYILLVGLVLILYAMFDEKKKQTNIEKPKVEEKHPIENQPIEKEKEIVVEENESKPGEESPVLEENKEE